MNSIKLCTTTRNLDIIDSIDSVRLMIRHLDVGAIPTTSTINTYAGYADSILRHKKRQVCVYDGDELGSMHGIEEWSYRDVSAVTANTTTKCKRK